ncbi:HEPN domain-containing protein [Deefgea sp. CFH1-16]|uniref:HEPN domain-containing protein n=1 Tax=Deefgea sp. CFH1-16 TaxID=2675457 RepID=UPI0015F73E80|nr:HEPN domain-containing protein [Deefgea sp. CFH1-16]MBM5575174.1 hypothetical protein [Deefgea sp. CFH1-16]
MEIHFNNKIFVTIAFNEKVAIDTAIQSVNTLLRFLEIIAGRPQSVQSLAFMMASTTTNLPNSLSVYWSMFPPSEADATERKPHPTDLPIQAAQTPEYFANVLTNWLAKNQEWQDARFRFSNGFAQQHNFTIDRLVGAANMFDILPASAVPADLPLSEELEKAKNSTRTLFRSLSQSPEKDSVLGALGRLGKASLKRKIRSRAQLILDQVPANFPELVMVIDEAVNCRNYFVHGSDTKKMNYSDEFNQVVFFTEVLEFIFAASDLIECGWDIRTWSKQRSTLSHPFGRFRVNYELQLQDLKRAIAAAKS